tara:strand:+ start:7011 stop:7769 length:759 start_codon:yes stop_codon:yes gene_type:complete
MLMHYGNKRTVAGGALLVAVATAACVPWRAGDTARTPGDVRVLMVFSGMGREPWSYAWAHIEGTDWIGMRSEPLYDGCAVLSSVLSQIGAHARAVVVAHSLGCVQAAMMHTCADRLEAVLLLAPPVASLFAGFGNDLRILAGRTRVRRVVGTFECLAPYAVQTPCAACDDIAVANASHSGWALLRDGDNPSALARASACGGVLSNAAQVEEARYQLRALVAGERATSTHPVAAPLCCVPPQLFGSDMAQFAS